MIFVSIWGFVVVWSIIREEDPILAFFNGSPILMMADVQNPPASSPST